jgi:N-glycosylase/DNA lyase|tara:strand:- start:811 stop:1434 length:624 start_codon:yes stop_codon:yes gene_type:complete
MNKLVKIVENLKKSSIKEIANKRMNEFEKLGKKDSNEIFKELCFCLLTANFSAKGGIRIQNEINDNFLFLSKSKLAKKLSKLGHRFPNARAKYIIEARKFKDDIKEILNSFKDEEKREWLVKNINGLGLKESSHFLRNIGYKDVAIIDFHIIDLLVKNKIIEKPKTITPKKYLEIEKILKKIAEKTNTNLGELDLYLWYEETGKVLK